METIAILISLLSLLLAAGAYWRSGGKQGVEATCRTLGREMEALRARQQELSETLRVRLEEAYERSSETLQETGEALHRLKEQAITELEAQVERATQQWQRLQQRVAEGWTSARDSALDAAHRLQVTLGRRVHRLEARCSLLYAKGCVVLATRCVDKGDFQRAEQRLDEATALLALARETLRADHTQDEQFRTVKTALSEAIAAVRAGSPDVRPLLKRVLAETDRLLEALETSEREAAGESPSPAGR